MVATTRFCVKSITETLFEFWLATNAREPPGWYSSQTGLVPTGTVAKIEFVAESMIATLFCPGTTTPIDEPPGATASLPGGEPRLIVVTNDLETVSITETLADPETYAREPFGVINSQRGPGPVGTVAMTLATVVSIT